jgi:NAD(P)-dependent dehydrogenase (short-subunit alcohol dehydrogenase family)
MTTIDGAVALVTGGNRGLGKAIVDELVARGASKVYATARHPQASNDPRVIPLQLDVTDPDSVARAATTASDVSIVVNNAGVALRYDLLTADLDDFRSEFETNLVGTLLVARAFAPVLAEHERSALVNVASVLSWFSNNSGYSVTKAAVWSASNALRQSLAEQGTVVTTLHVGYMDTDMTAGIDAPKADPRDVARQAVDGIEAGDYEVLADELSRQVKSQLSAPVAALYPQLAGV